ncbi:T9SS type A sorting domain-containing protein [Pontibacter mangrovi]|uniref:T9SS type A sorting domain-containing protein n=1 Tax=Pontibacter mangrovi TaxID=2589816 RepID=UPI0015E3C804|nr:T9SS type A sorting domain-containing protein [Pontibacter mangrovi]
MTATIIQTPTASISTSTPTTVCEGGSVLLTAVATPATPAVGSYTYQWYDGGQAIVNATASTYTASATGNYTVVITNTAGPCVSAASAPVAVTVNPFPVAEVTAATETELCEGESVILNVTPVEGATYQWQLNGADITGETGTSFTADAPGSYTVVVTTNSCPTTSNAIAVSVNPMPVAVITQGPEALLCEGGQVTLTAQTGAGYSYQWYLDGSPIATATESAYNATEAGAYTVEVTLGNCTASSEATTVTEQLLPTVAILASPDEPVCAGESVVLTASINPETPATGSYTYRWFEAGAPATTLGTDATFAAFASGVYNVEVTVNTCSVTAISPVTVTVNQRPAANITATGPLDFCEGGSVTLNVSDAVPVGDSYTYEWFNGSTSLGNNSPSLNVTASGTYTVSITNSAGCTNTAEAVIVRVGTIEEAAITYSEPTEFCEGSSIVLEATQAPAGQTYTYQWLSGGVEIEGATDRTYTATATGNYSVLVSNNGCSKSSAEVFVNVLPQPSAAIEGGNQETCFVPGSTASFSLEATFTGETAAWSSSNPNFAITNPVYDVENGRATATVIVTGTGNATITLTSSSAVAACGIGTSSVVLLVKPLPETTITPGGPVAFCQGDEVVLNAPEGTGYTYQWLLNGESLNAVGRSYTASVAGDYTVIVTNNECSAVSAPVTVTVNPLPSAEIIPSGSTVFCEGGSVTLTASSDLGTSFTWFRDGVQVGEGETYTASTAGSYTLQALAEGTGCINTSDPTVVVVNTAPTVSIQTSGSTTICQGSSVTLTAQATPAGASYTYQWFRGTTPVATTQQFTASQAGDYSVRVTNTATNCATTSNVTVTVTPNPVADAGGNKTVCSGQPVVLGAPAVAGYTYSWSPSTGLTSATAAQPTATITNTGTSSITRTYILTVTANGCTSTSSAIVTVTPAIAQNTISTTTTTACAGTTLSAITGSTPVGGNGPYAYKWESSITSATAGFSAATGSNAGQSYNPGTRSQTTWFRRLVTSGGCAVSVSNVVQVTVTPTTTYTLVLTANPFPVCPGQNTTYTATVLANVTSVNYPANPRYEQITWEGGTDVTSQFEFDWWKNDNNDRSEGQTGPTISLAGLSSTDYYTVRAKPKSGVNLSCPVYANPPSLTPPTNPDGAVLFSNRIYLGRPSDYGVSISRTPIGSICPGTPVTFTATPNAEYVNLTIEWIVRNSAGNIVASRPMNASRTFTSNTLQNGDVVSLNFTSDENKCSPVASSNAITMVVVVDQQLTGGGAYCVGSTSNVPVGLAGSQVGVSYQLRRNGSDIVRTVEGTGGPISFGPQQAGMYTVLPVSANGSCTQYPGAVTIYETPLPVTSYEVTVTNNGQYCEGGAGVTVGLNGSQAGVRYQLVKDGVLQTGSGAIVDGTGGAISFGTRTAGTYTVRATTIQGGTAASCSQDITNGKTVVMNPLPLAQSVEGTSYCTNQPGAQLSLAASQAGVTYALYSGGTKLADGANVNGTITFDYAAVAGTSYYIVATNTTTGCSSQFNVPAISTETPQPQFVEISIDPNPLEFGKPAKFTALPTNSGSSPTFQWYKYNFETFEFEAVEGATGSVYAVDNLQDDPIKMRVEVTASADACVTNAVALAETGTLDPLPVEIMYFRAVRQGNDAVLEWATAMEERNSGFEVQVSEDGFSFRKLAFVPTQNGNTVLKQVYRYTDRENGKRGTRYYRLKQVDEDGAFEYFTTKALNYGEVASQVKAFPNPFTTQITLDIAAEQSGMAQVAMYNAVGRQLLERTIEVEAGFNTAVLQVSPDLPHGVYFVRVLLEGNVYNLKLLKE